MTDKPDLSCKADCPECGGNGFIGGDTQSAWSCHTHVVRYMKYHKIGWYGTKEGLEFLEKEANGNTST